MTAFQNQAIFIELFPGRRSRLIDLLITSVTGIALLAVSLAAYFLMKQFVLLHFLSIPAALYVIWYGWSIYMNPEKKIWPQIDTLRNLIGFMIIAHASGMFSNSPGLQWSHIFIIIGAIIIFMGVMFPKEKNKCGFTISESMLTVKSASLKKAAEIDIKGIIDISCLTNQLRIQRNDGSEYLFNLGNFDKVNESVAQLKEVLKGSKYPSHQTDHNRS